MKNLVLAGVSATVLAVVLAIVIAGTALAQNTTSSSGATVTAGGAATATADAAAVVPGLADLEKTTFACPKAALNAAAREVATHKSQGTYQFSYFNIVSGSHHAAYEVHFTSNYSEEPVLKFCVALYCQQGFDPATTVSVMPLGAKTSPSATATATGAGASAGTMTTGHAADPCNPPRPAARRRATR